MNERLERFDVALFGDAQTTPIDVFVRDSEAGQRTLLCLHGFGDNLHTWQEVRARVEPLGARVVALDLPGLGRSPLDPAFARSYLVNAIALARAVAARLRADGMPLFVAGNSLGGAVALGLAADDERAGARLDGLLLLAPATPRTRLPIFAHLARTPFFHWSGGVQRHMPERARRAVGALVARASLRLILAPDFRAPRRWRDSIIESFSRPGCFDDLERIARDVLWTLRGRNEAANELGERIGRISTPTVLVRGELDAVVGREETRRLAASLPRARLIELAGVGHCPQNEAPDRCEAAFGELCGGLAV